MAWTNKKVLSMFKINKLFPIKYRFTKKFSLWKYSIRIEERSKDNLWGRFGGGWDWKLGIQIGGSTIIISLLVGEIIINKNG